MSLKDMKIDLTGVPEEQAISIAKSLAKLQEVVKAFAEEYETILPLYSGDGSKNSDIYSGYTFEEFEELSMADVAYAILKNVDTISEHLEISMEEVVERALESTEWYKKALNDASSDGRLTITPLLAKPKRIENYLMSTDKVSKALSTGFLENGDENVEINMTNDKKYQAIVSMEFLNLPYVQKSESFNSFEWQVHNAMVSLALKNDWITDYMIYEVVTRSYYNKADANPAESTLKEIREIVEKIINCHITIDTSKDIPLKGEEQRLFKGALISADTETRILNGRVREGYLIHRNSLAYFYASEKGQVITVPLKLLHTKLRFSKEVSIFKEYLVQRIALMKNANNKIRSNDILYETAFENIPFTQKTASGIANKKSKLRGFAVTMLEELKAEGFIKGFSVQKKDRITIQV